MSNLSPIEQRRRAYAKGHYIQTNGVDAKTPCTFCSKANIPCRLHPASSTFKCADCYARNHKCTGAEAPDGFVRVFDPDDSLFGSKVDWDTDFELYADLQSKFDDLKAEQDAIARGERQAKAPRVYKNSKAAEKRRAEQAERSESAEDSEGTVQVKKQKTNAYVRKLEQKIIQLTFSEDDLKAKLLAMTEQAQRFREKYLKSEDEKKALKDRLQQLEASGEEEEDQGDEEDQGEEVEQAGEEEQAEEEEESEEQTDENEQSEDEEEEDEAD